ncbi:26S proteasome non-ATPase regulatory subunit 7 like protein B [Astathelohania contejeani]|uniref:26S proteasome non-ATPase regulatory subunit 7 like protein B n=1 Tax=Astathelohania contejeani TaxID=164912 RepID=A0ABQ7HW91_9MICR|nr:26S proteasome non-ATPase regulatory subunit 7 like protein B [Thelohania contejeani]
MIDNVIVHPLVLLSVVDHYRRVDNKRVVGVLLGTKEEDNTIHVSNSFAVPFDEDNKGNWLFDTSYQQNMFDLFKKVNSTELIVGWYHTGPKMHANDLEITRSFLSIVKEPVMIIVDVKLEEVGLPVQAFSLDPKHEEFIHVGSKIEAEEAEEVGVEHLIRDLRDATMCNSFGHVKEITNSLRIYENNLENIENYLQDVIDGKLPSNNELIFFLQECLNDIPKMQKRESMKGCYLAALTKSVISLTDLARNKEKISDKQ